VYARGSDPRKQSRFSSEVQLPPREENAIDVFLKRAGKYTKAPSEVYTKVNQPKSVEKK
jgi:hypothetical protein